MENSSIAQIPLNPNGVYNINSAPKGGVDWWLQVHVALRNHLCTAPKYSALFTVKPPTNIMGFVLC